MTLYDHCDDATYMVQYDPVLSFQEAARLAAEAADAAEAARLAAGADMPALPQPKFHMAGLEDFEPFVGEDGKVRMEGVALDDELATLGVSEARRDMIMGDTRHSRPVMTRARAPRQEEAARLTADAAAATEVGFGRIVGLKHRSGTTHRIC